MSFIGTDLQCSFQQRLVRSTAGPGLSQGAQERALAPLPLAEVRVRGGVALLVLAPRLLGCLWFGKSGGVISPNGVSVGNATLGGGGEIWGSS